MAVGIMPKVAKKISPERDKTDRVNRCQKSINDALESEKCVLSAGMIKLFYLEDGKTQYAGMLKTNFLARCKLPDEIILLPQVQVLPSADNPPNGQ